MSFTKNFISTTLFLLVLFTLINAQNNTWIKYYGTTLQDFGSSVRQTNDNGFILGGSNYLGGPAPYYFDYISLLKTDSLGNEIWNKHYSQGRCNRVEVTKDYGFLIIASNCIIKTNSNGIQVWKYEPDTTSIYTGCITEDGGSIMVGAKYNEYVIWIIKCDSLGNQQWIKTYDNFSARGNCIQTTPDSGYILTAKCYGSHDFWLLKLDNQGDTTWTKTYNGIYGEYIDVCENGDFIITGFTKYQTNEPEKIMLMRTSCDGNILWEKRFDKGRGESVRQTKNGNFIITGRDDNLWTLNLINTDSTGNSKFIKTYDQQLVGGADVVESNDGGYVAIGSANPISGGYDICLLKTDSLGNVANLSSLSDINDKNNFDYELIYNYPNPFNSVTLIYYKVQYKSRINLSLYDILGRKIMTLYNGIQDIGEHKYNLNAVNLNSGIYFIRMETKTQSFMKKCVLIK